MMSGDRDPGYERFTRVLRGAVSSQVRVQPAPYRAVTLGPRHTFGGTLLQCADFGIAPMTSVDVRASGVEDLGLMAQRSANLVTPRAPLVGFYDGDIAVGVPSLPSTYDAATVVISPVIDLLFWREKRDHYPKRGDDSFTFNLTNGQKAAVPCFHRRSVTITVDCTADGSVEIYAGNASATNVHDIGAGKALVTLTAGKRASFDAHELVTATGVSPWTPASIVGVSRPDWLYFDIANNATMAITVLASDDV